MAVLVCGGAGYIGSHMVYELINNGEDVVVIDNLETGHLASVHEKAKFYKGDIRNMADLDKVFTENDIEAIIHFAANSLVGESMQVPLKYFNNNTCGMEVLLEAMVKYDVKKIVFSSTAATYGEPKRVPILETDETNPTNPYGESKRMMEKMMNHGGLMYTPTDDPEICSHPANCLMVRIGRDVDQHTIDQFDRLRFARRYATYE